MFMIIHHQNGSACVLNGRRAVIGTKKTNRWRSLRTNTTHESGRERKLSLCLSGHMWRVTQRCGPLREHRDGSQHALVHTQDSNRVCTCRVLIGTDKHWNHLSEASRKKKKKTVLKVHLMPTPEILFLILILQLLYFYLINSSTYRIQAKLRGLSHIITITYFNPPQ